jgi:hypothetical protein
MVRIHRQVPLAAELQIQHRMPGEQRQHVVKEGNAGLDGRFARPVNVQFDRDAGFFGRAAKFCPSGFHLGAI